MLSPHKYILHQACKYPSSYSYTYENSKFKILDHLFNNGACDSIDDFLLSIKCEPFDEKEAERYVLGEPIWYGFMEHPIISVKLKKPLIEIHKRSVVTLESDKHKHPEILFWEKREDYKFSVSSGFEKYCSLVWKIPIKVFNNEWISSALWYYTKCKEYFLTEPTDYHDSFPGENLTEQQAIHYMTNRFNADYGNTWDYEKIYAEYEVDFTGDIRDFLIRKWKKELSRINQFLDETIDLLNFRCLNR